MRASPSSSRIIRLPARRPGGIVVSWRASCALLFYVACGGEAPSRDATAYAIEVVDGVGRTVRLDSAARRVVSLIPGRTDVILALGAEDRLVARTRYDEDPRIAHLPSLGDALTPSVEWLALQEPDLVIAWPDRQSRSVVTRLHELGIPVYSSGVESIAQTRSSILDIGELLGLSVRADSIVRRLDAVLDSVRDAHAEGARPAVLYLIGLEPPQAAGPGTFIDEMIAVAGGRNALADASVLWPTISVEDIVTRQPDVVIVSTATEAHGAILESVRARAGWRSLSAVQTGRVHVVDASLMNRPGPALIEAIVTLADAIHGQTVGPK